MAGRKQQRLVGLAFEGKALSICEMHRSNGDVKVDVASRAEMSVDILTDDPALAARELQQILQAASVHSRDCVVSVPARWALAALVEVPEGLSKQDKDAFIYLTAEREFPYPPDDLSMVILDGGRESGKGGAVLVVALPLSYIEPLRRVLVAAKLKPLALTITTLALGDAMERKENLVFLRFGERDAELALYESGRLRALRAIHDVMLRDGHGRSLDMEGLLRELRISLAQNRNMQASRILLCGDEQMARPVSERIVQDLALEVEMCDPQWAHPATMLARGCLMSADLPTQFLPPQPGLLERLSTRFASRSMMHWAAVGAGLVLLVILAFFFQGWRLRALEARWAAIEPTVSEVSSIQSRIREFRPWFALEPERLEMLAVLTEAFPETGTVWARTVQIKDHSDLVGASIVSCTGYARSDQAWLDVLEKLRRNDAVSDVKTQQIRGESPKQFNLQFTWNKGGS